MDLSNDSRVFKKVVSNEGTRDGAPPIKLDLNQFAKARGIFVTQGLGISKSFKDRVGGENTGGDLWNGSVRMKGENKRARPSAPDEAEATVRNFRMILVASVFPEPDSPEMTTDCA